MVSQAHFELARSARLIPACGPEPGMRVDHDGSTLVIDHTAAGTQQIQGKQGLWVKHGRLGI